MTETVDQTCEAVWRRVTKGIPERNIAGERERDGNYIRGYRLDVDTWTLLFGSLKLRAMLIDWQTFSLASDCTGMRRSVEISNGDTVVFRADQDGLRTEIRFAGNDERFVGSRDCPATPWRITLGDVAMIAQINQ